MAASHDQRAGLESFQLVIHAADMEPREFTVDMSAFTAPHSLRRILPADVCRQRLHWLPLEMLHPTLGVRPGRYHFVVGSTLPGPSRPVLVLLCFATGAYMERWQHEVRWIPFCLNPPLVASFHVLGGHVWWKHYNWFRHHCSLVDMNR